MDLSQTALIGRHGPGKWTKTTLAELGKKLWGLCAKNNKLESSDLYESYIFEHIHEHEPVLADLLSRLPTDQIITVWSTYWADVGFPAFQLGHKYAAALLATSCGKVDDIREPFKAFLIEIPPGLISFGSRAGESQVMNIIVLRRKDKDGKELWTWAALTDTTAALWDNATMEMMTSDEHVTSKLNESDPFAEDILDSDKRVVILIRRLILNTCLAVSSPDNLKPVGKAKHVSVSEARSCKEPIVRTFQVGKPITLDCRQAVRDYIEGKKRGSINVQVLVAGHWRRQAYGVGREQRKWIHIEPYWKGSEEAPILVRPHVAGKEKP